MKYKILASYSPWELQDSINDLAALGWEVHGGISVSDDGTMAVIMERADD